MAASPGSTYIVKPPGAAQGDGIFLVRSVADLQRHVARLTDGPVIVQRVLQHIAAHAATLSPVD